MTALEQQRRSIVVAETAEGLISQLQRVLIASEMMTWSKTEFNQSIVQVLRDTAKRFEKEQGKVGFVR